MRHEAPRLSTGASTLVSAGPSPRGEKRRENSSSGVWGMFFQREKNMGVLGVFDWHRFGVLYKVGFIADVKLRVWCLGVCCICGVCSV